MARTFSMQRLSIAWIGACLLAGSYCAYGQTPPTNQASVQHKFDCHRPADPHRRQHGCNDEDFGWDETLAGGWDKIRQVMKRIGITPTASYVGALQTNVTGDQDQVWSYAGQLSVAASADFGELLKIPGLSAYVGASWGTGSNLSGSLETEIPTSGLYAPSFYLGEMYLPQKLVPQKLTFLAERLAAAHTLASLNKFTNTVNYGIYRNMY